MSFDFILLLNGLEDDLTNYLKTSKHMNLMYLQAPLSFLLIPVLQLWIPSGGAAQSNPNMSSQINLQ